MEALRFIFSSFWIWLGAVILVGVAGSSLGGMFRLTFRPILKEKSRDDK
jgi:hypothetical protein